MPAAAEAHVPDAVAPPPRHPRFPQADGLRAVAVLCVVGVHALNAMGIDGSVGGRLALHLNVGVTIFFLLSGFLLYRPFIAHRNEGARAPKTVDYLRRRALRILPAYWLVVIAVILLPGITATSDDRWIQQFTLVFSLFSDGGWACTECGLTQTWSLVVELTFYLALPLYALLAGRLLDGRPRRVWVSADLAALAALSLASLWIQFVRYDGVPPTWIGGSLLSFGLWFALGMGLAVASVALRGGDGRPLRPLGARGAAACWIAAIALYVVVALSLPVTFVLVDVSEQLTAFLAFAAISLLLLAPAVLGPDGRGAVARFLTWRPVAWVGLISYGVFLWHIVVIRKLLTLDVGWSSITLLLATIAVTIPIAALSYYAVERPLLRFKYRRAEGGGRASSRPAGRAA